MSYNTISYMIYAPITIYITVIVGYQCYKNGLVYVQSIFEDDNVSAAINKILLIGYYLTNIGYAIMVIKDWNKVDTIYQMLNELSVRIATIVLMLAFLHYINIIVLSLWRKSTNKISINQKI